jgi:putative ABC transport system permease protein
LVVAVNACLGLGNAIINNVDDVQQWHRRWLTGDVVLLNASADFAGASNDRAELRRQILAQPDVATVVETHLLSCRVESVAATCFVRDFLNDDEMPWRITAGDSRSAIAQLHSGDAVIGSVLAQRLKLQPGDPLRLEVGGRALPVHIAAIANDYNMGGLAVYLDRNAAEQRLTLGRATFYLVRAKPGAAAALAEELAPLAKQSDLLVRSFAEMDEPLDRVIRGIVGALWGLLAVGFVVGCMAVANALTMNVLEQTGEIGLLRILGMTRRQVRGVVLCESFLLGILGTLLGVVAGVVTAAVIHFCNEPLLGHALSFRFHATLLLVNAAGCLLVALLAGWSPGARAARLNLTAAIAYE